MQKLVIAVAVTLAGGCASSQASPRAGAPSLFTDEFHDSTRWLAHELGLGGPVVEGARPGP